MVQRPSPLQRIGLTMAFSMANMGVDPAELEAAVNGEIEKIQNVKIQPILHLSEFYLRRKIIDFEISIHTMQTQMTCMRASFG